MTLFLNARPYDKKWREENGLETEGHWTVPSDGEYWVRFLEAKESVDHKIKQFDTLIEAFDFLNENYSGMVVFNGQCVYRKWELLL